MTDADTDEDDQTPLRKRIPWRRLANGMGVLILLAIVIPFVIFALPQVAGAKGSYVVLSGSMEPAISPGDVIITDGVDASAIESGDVITFRQSGDKRPTTHRVIDIEEQNGERAFRTKGDANEDPDRQLVAPGDVQGRVMTIGGYLFVIPLIGHVIQFTNTQLGFATFFIVPLVLLVLSEVWNTARSVRGTDQPDGDDATDTNTTRDTQDTTQEKESKTEAEEPDTAETESNGDVGVTFTAPELQLGLITLGAFLAYSIWVTYATLEIWAFAVAGSAATAFLLIAIMYSFGSTPNDDTEHNSNTAAEEDDKTTEESTYASQPSEKRENGGADRETAPGEISWMTADLSEFNPAVIEMETQLTANETHDGQTRSESDD